MLFVLISAGISIGLLAIMYRLLLDPSFNGPLLFVPGFVLIATGIAIFFSTYRWIASGSAVSAVLGPLVRVLWMVCANVVWIFVCYNWNQVDEWIAYVAYIPIVVSALACAVLVGRVLMRVFRLDVR